MMFLSFLWNADSLVSTFQARIQVIMNQLRLRSFDSRYSQEINSSFEREAVLFILLSLNT